MKTKLTLVLSIFAMLFAATFTATAEETVVAVEITSCNAEGEVACDKATEGKKANKKPNGKKGKKAKGKKGNAEVDTDADAEDATE